MNRRSTVKSKGLQLEDPEDFFLKAIKSKGFCHGKRRETMLQDKFMKIEELQVKLKPGLRSYTHLKMSQPFASYIIQQLIKQQPDLSVIERELISVWNCIEHTKHTELGKVYSNFLNDVFTANQMAFFVQAHRVID